MKRRIGVMGAMKEETSLLVDAMEGAAVTTIGGRNDVADISRAYHCGELYGRDCVVVFSRWGKVASASTVTTLIDHFDVDFVVFTGVAGALEPDLDIGDVVVGREFIQYDMDARPLFAQFELPFPDLNLHMSRIPADPETVDDALSSVNEFISRKQWETLPKARAGLIASADTFLDDADAAAKLRAMLPDAQCVEMEGAAVAQVCWERNVPLAVIRVISDKADHSAGIDFQRFITDIASHFTAGVVRTLIQHA